MKHSPGIWHIRPDYGQQNVYCLWDKNDNYHDDTSPERMDANANLLAAAPELLAALKRALPCIDSACPAMQLEIINLIAKAEGSCTHADLP